MQPKALIQGEIIPQRGLAHRSGGGGGDTGDGGESGCGGLGDLADTDILALAEYVYTLLKADLAQCRERTGYRAGDMALPILGRLG